MATLLPGSSTFHTRTRSFLLEGPFFSFVFKGNQRSTTHLWCSPHRSWQGTLPFCGAISEYPVSCMTIGTQTLRDELTNSEYLSIRRFLWDCFSEAKGPGASSERRGDGQLPQRLRGGWMGRGPGAATRRLWQRPKKNSAGSSAYPVEKPASTREKEGEPTF